MNVDTLLHQYFPKAGNVCIKDKVSDGKGLGFGLYSTSRLINTAGHKLIVRSGSHTLTANGDMHITESAPWSGTIVYFELRSNMDIDPSSVVDHRTDPAEEFNELFLEDNSGLDKSW